MNTTTAPAATVTTRQIPAWQGIGPIYTVDIGNRRIAAHQWLDDAEKHADLVNALGEPAERIKFGRRITFDTGTRDRRSRPVVLSVPANEETRIIAKVIREYTAA